MPAKVITARDSPPVVARRPVWGLLTEVPLKQDEGPAPPISTANIRIVKAQFDATMDEYLKRGSLPATRVELFVDELLGQGVALFDARGTLIVHIQSVVITEPSSEVLMWHILAKIGVPENIFDGIHDLIQKVKNTSYGLVIADGGCGWDYWRVEREREL